MTANVESVFYTREKPWHRLGKKVEEAPTSADALRLVGLDWEVVQENIFTGTGNSVPGYKVNIRDSDRRVLGVVSDRYKIIQNREAFAFTDTLLGDGVRYETAGSLQDGRQKVSDAQVKEYIELLLPMEKNPTPIQSKNIIKLRRDIEQRYYDAPDLQEVGNNAYRFLNAVSDFATHSSPLCRTANYNENLFARTIDGNPFIDRAYQLVKAA